MKAAFSIWNGRIAPVFDVAEKVHLVQAESGSVLKETDSTLPVEPQAVRAARLSELDIDTLVCGAISRSMQIMVESYDIQVMPFMAGNLRDIIQAWLCGSLGEGVYAMPGCCNPNRLRHRGADNFQQENHLMRGRNRGGMNPQKGQGRGRMGGSKAGGASGTCLCPKCGHSEPHERGMPCVQKLCPNCGTVMTRE